MCHVLINSNIFFWLIHRLFDTFWYCATTLLCFTSVISGLLCFGLFLLCTLHLGAPLCCLLVTETTVFVCLLLKPLCFLLVTETTVCLQVSYEEYDPVSYTSEAILAKPSYADEIDLLNM